MKTITVFLTIFGVLALSSPCIVLEASKIARVTFDLKDLAICSGITFVVLLVLLFFPILAMTKEKKQETPQVKLKPPKVRMRR